MLEPRRALFAAVVLLSLGGCGGGGDDDEDEAAPEDDSAAGVWRGSYRLAGGPLRQFDLIAASDGRFAGVIAPTNVGGTDGRILVGTGDVTIRNVTATGTYYAPAQFSGGAVAAPISAFSGTVTEGVSLEGSFSGGGETGTYSLTYSPTSARPSSLATVQGVYTSSNNQISIAITSSGQLTFNTAGGCVGNGTVSVVDPSLNVYAWSMTVANCAGSGSPRGLASLADFNGAQNNLLLMMGEQTDRGVYIVVAK